MELIPKKEVGAYRIIHHLSHPPGSSINDFIDEVDSTVQYTSFNTAIEIMANLGKGAMLGKADIKSAFRLLPMHPDDYELLGSKCLFAYFLVFALSFRK